MLGQTELVKGVVEPYAIGVKNISHLRLYDCTPLGTAAAVAQLNTVQ